MSKLRIAMLAPAWLRVPASGYGGIEAMVHNLCRGLREQGIYVELFGVRGSETPANRYHWLYQEEQFQHINKLLYDAVAIPAAHMLSSLEAIARGRFDIIHDHNGLIGPAMLRDRTELPPVLHTLHGPFANEERIQGGYIDTMPLYTQLSKGKRLYFNGISQAQLREAPRQLKTRLVGAIHHGIDPAEHKFYPKKSDYFVNVGRVAAEKGIHVAARLCAELGEKFKIGGLVAGIGDPRTLQQELTASRNDKTDFIYFRDKVLSYMEPGEIEYVGSVFGGDKDELIGRAKAFLMPIQWEEPFGVAVIDALVCGTPVIAMRRGSMPEIIEHGVNGFLADTPEQFVQYMMRVDDIDPAACRQSVEKRFSYPAMTREYIKLYQYIASRHPMPKPQFAGRLVPSTKAAFENFAPAPVSRRINPLK